MGRLTFDLSIGQYDISVLIPRATSRPWNYIRVAGRPPAVSVQFDGILTESGLTFQNVRSASVRQVANIHESLPSRVAIQHVSTNFAALNAAIDPIQDQVGSTALSEHKEHSSRIIQSLCSHAPEISRNLFNLNPLHSSPRCPVLAPHCQV